MVSVARVAFVISQLRSNRELSVKTQGAAETPIKKTSCIERRTEPREFPHIIYR
jgi:hypothetical protein